MASANHALQGHRKVTAKKGRDNVALPSGYELLTDERVDGILDDLAGGGEVKLQPEAEQWTYPAS